MLSRPVGWALVLGLSAVSLAWLWRGTGVAATSAITEAAPVVVAAPVSPAPRVEVVAPIAPAAVAPPMPYTYVGSWRDGNRLHLFLKHGDVTRTVTGLTAVDDRYVVVAADDERVSLRYLPLGTVQVLRLERPRQSTPTELTRTPSARSDSEAQSEEN